MYKLWAILLILLVAGCGSFGTTRTIVAIPDPEMTYLNKTKGVAITKGNISVVAVSLPDVKDLDGFGIMIINDTPNWISIKKEECMLVQNGQVIYPLDHAKAMSRLGAGYKPQMPTDLVADIANWRREVNFKSSQLTKVEEGDKDNIKKISIIAGSRQNIFLYFNTQGNTAPMQLIIPNVYNEATNQKTSFSFRFALEEKKIK